MSLMFSSPNNLSKMYSTSPPRITTTSTSSSSHNNNNNNNNSTTTTTKTSAPKARIASAGAAATSAPPRLIISSSTLSVQRDYFRDYEHEKRQKWQHYYVLPVLLMEFTALALTRAVLPALLLHEYGDHVYIVMGCADFVRGLLAFMACPLFGKISDVLGRRLCLFITVLGTCAPVCSLALFSWEAVVLSVAEEENIGITENVVLEETTPAFDTTSKIESGDDQQQQDDWSFGLAAAAATSTTPITTATVSHPYAITIFIILLSLSGVFSSTFTLVFAYISDTVRVQEERVSAYGLALATFGLSFTIGPMAGGYLAQTNPQYVFLSSLILTCLDLLYIYAVLPESRQFATSVTSATTGTKTDASVASLISNDLNFSWNPIDSIQLVLTDPFLRQVGKVALLYYTGLWALISTLSVYAVKHFHLGPNRLGELMSALGLSTMVAEAVLVRILVPLLGEKRAMKLGLCSFAIQCVVLGFAYETWHLFLCAAFSILGNLVYPSLSSLVSGSVEPEMVGEALGAINGIKALTEGVGPLVFGTLMTMSEHSALPGWPYLLAAVLIIGAYKETEALPDVEDDDYIHELDRKKQRQQRRRNPKGKEKSRSASGLMRNFMTSRRQNHWQDFEDDDEVEELLSDVDESWDEDDEEAYRMAQLNEGESRTHGSFSSSLESQQMPITLGSLTKL